MSITIFAIDDDLRVKVIDEWEFPPCPCCGRETRGRRLSCRMDLYRLEGNSETFIASDPYELPFGSDAWENWQRAGQDAIAYAEAHA